MKKNIIYCLLILVFLTSSSATIHHPQIVWKEGAAVRQQSDLLGKIIRHLTNPDENYVLVASHRGDWRNAPENSVQAIKNAIAMGVDIVEIDVQKTKDGRLVLMHDPTIDRTTNGKGNVSDYTLDELKKFRLRNGLQRPTFHSIPTLEEALLAAKGKIIVNLDKCYDYFDEAYKVLDKTGTIGQTIMKGHIDYKQVSEEHGEYLGKIFFMPVIDASKQNAVRILSEYMKNMKPVACEISSVPSVDAPMLKEFKGIRKSGTRVWMNSLWADQCAGYDDDRAVLNADSIYGWYLKIGVNMIQTDRPAFLLNWLRNKKLHD